MATNMATMKTRTEKHNLHAFILLLFITLCVNYMICTFDTFNQKQTQNNRDECCNFIQNFKIDVGENGDRRQRLQVPKGSMGNIEY